MAFCEISIEGEMKNYISDYNEEKNILDLDIHNYSDVVSEMQLGNEIKYKSLIVKDYKNNFFAYSPIFYNTNITFGLVSYESYKTDFYFTTNKIENISEFDKNMKIKVITFHHPMLINFFTNPCLSIKTTSDYYQYQLKRTEIDKKEIIINKNNIHKLVLGGEYSVSEKNQNQSINIETKNFIKLYLINEIGYDEVLEYIHEMNIYLNAYFPIGLASYETYITTSNDKEFKLVHKLLGENEHYRKPYYIFIKNNFFEYIEKMYLNTNYRTSPTKNNFLPLEFKQPISLEDKFLFYFRYIDMYMGDKLSKQELKKPSNFERLSEFVDNNQDLFTDADLSNVNFKNELNSLRNHYVHEGYYLANNKFKVTKNKKFLYEKEIECAWLCDIVNAFKFGVYKLMYKEVLGFDIDEGRLKIVLNLI